MLDIQTLHTLLRGPLPGALAHDIMAPEPPLNRSGRKARKAAVLMLLSPLEGRPAESIHDLAVTLIRRTRSTHHSYELAFPGGLRERFESVQATALREAHEEIGVAVENIQVLGPLSTVGTATSHTVIHPLLAVAGRQPEFRPNREVAAVLQVPLRALREPNNRRVEYADHPELGMRRIPYFAIGVEKLWGASAKIMAELLVGLYGDEFLNRTGCLRAAPAGPAARVAPRDE